MPTQWQQSIETRLKNIEGLLAKLVAGLEGLSSLRGQMEEISFRMSSLTRRFEADKHRDSRQVLLIEKPEIASDFKQLNGYLADISGILERRQEFYSPREELGNRFQSARRILDGLGRHGRFRLGQARGWLSKQYVS